MTCFVLLLGDSAAALSFALRLLKANLFLYLWVQMPMYVCSNLHRMHLCTLDVACLAFQSNVSKICSCNWSVSNTSNF